MHTKISKDEILPIYSRDISSQTFSQNDLRLLNCSVILHAFALYSLLSHSAVVARELGLPTVVGVSGGLMKRLKVSV